MHRGRHGAPTSRRWRSTALATVALGAVAALLVGCTGGSKSASPTTVAGGGDGSSTTAKGGTTTTASTAPPTTVSKYVTAGEKHTLPDGTTVAPSYAKAQLAIPKGVATPPSGQAYAFFTVKMCAPKDHEVLLQPSKFKVEVPGQGYVAWSASTPEIRKPNIGVDTPVPAGTCVSGNIHYVIGGELHIEAIRYEAANGAYLWAS